MAIDIYSVYIPSEDIVAREIKGELIIIPLAAGVGDLEDELFTLNDTAKAIWKQLDGKRNLAEITANLVNEYHTNPDVIEQDVLGIVNELVNLKIVVNIDDL